MQFVDQLTQISHDMRLFPKAETSAGVDLRHRRIRPRMKSRGSISLDVNDNNNNVDTFHDDEWPTIYDLTMDILQYSIHLPFIPSSPARMWPTSASSMSSSNDSNINNLNNKNNNDNSKHNSNSMGDGVHDDDHQNQQQQFQSIVDYSTTKVVQVLNIVVVDETKTLASRERCPFLLHVEVSDTGYEERAICNLSFHESISFL
jgi:hypothetical protein